MKFSQEIFNAAKQIFDEYLEHPFVKQMGEGILSKDKFKRYLIQDYLYLKEYAKSFALGIVKAQNMNEMKLFTQAVVGVLDDEISAVHIKYLMDFGIDKNSLEDYEIEFENSSYVSYMQAISLQGGVKEIAMATLACTWSYFYIGENLKQKYSHTLEHNFYAPWIESYSSAEYEECTQMWLNYIDRITIDSNEEEKKKLIDIFIKACIHEMRFWDMSYKD